MKLKPIATNQTELHNDNDIVFFSYETPVAVFISGKGAYVTEKKWSATTTRHINKTIERWGCSKAYATQEYIEKLASQF